MHDNKVAGLRGGELDLLFQAAAYDADSDLVFAHPHTGKPIDPSKLLKRYTAALRRAGVRDVRFHDLRHTFGTRMAAAGVPMRTLQEWMGHRDFATTLIYADYAPSAHEADLLDSAFGRPDPVATTAHSAERAGRGCVHCHNEDMARRPTTIYLDDEILQAAQAVAARLHRDESSVVEDALRSYLGFDVVEAAWQRSDLGEDEALALADAEKHASRE